MHSVFVNEDLNNLLNEQGYVIIKKFLSTTQTQTLVDFHQQSGSDKCRASFTTFAAEDFNYKKSVDEKIKEAFASSFIEHINGQYTPFWGNFFTKLPGGPSMPLHADWQYANEPNEISFNIWTPLIDTNTDNGAFGVVPKSHKVVNQPRGINLEQFYLERGEEIKLKHGQTLYLNCGDAIIYDHRLLHFSLPNNSNAARLAATLVGVNKNSEIVHYAADYEGGAVFKYKFSDVEDVLRISFKTKPIHLTPEKELGILNLKPLSLCDFEYFTS